jgi:hypothetical protein
MSEHSWGKLFHNLSYKQFSALPKGRGVEIITDTGKSGNVFVIHADKITPENEGLLSEVLQ